MSDDVHVLPIDDLREHVESEDCWCEPRIEGDGSSAWLITHHSADRREMEETDDGN